MFAPTDNANYKSATGTIILTVEKAEQALPDGLALVCEAFDDTSITLSALGDRYEYSNGGQHWQDSNRFDGYPITGIECDSSDRLHS